MRDQRHETLAPDKDTLTANGKHRDTAERARVSLALLESRECLLVYRFT